MATILMIDDDTGWVAAMRAMLEAKGHRFHSAPNGEKGLARVKEVNPDLIILDVMMDRYTEGFHISQSLRDPADESEYAAYRKVPILVFSAIHRTTPHRFAPDEDHFPVDEFHDKATPAPELLAAVERLLAKAAAGR